MGVFAGKKLFFVYFLPALILLNANDELDKLSLVQKNTKKTKGSQKVCVFIPFAQQAAH